MSEGDTVSDDEPFVAVCSVPGAGMGGPSGRKGGGDTDEPVEEVWGGITIAAYPAQVSLDQLYVSVRPLVCITRCGAPLSPTPTLTGSPRIAFV
jgi:hypothetical protein